MFCPRPMCRTRKEALRESAHSKLRVNRGLRECVGSIVLPPSLMFGTLENSIVDSKVSFCTEFLYCFRDFSFSSKYPFPLQCNEKKSNAIFYSLMSMSKIYLKGCRGQFGTSGTSDFFGKKIFVIFHFQ